MQMKPEIVKGMVAIPMAEGPWTASGEHVELWDVSDLIPKLWIARACSDQQLDGIASGIEVGRTKPARVDRHGHIIARHSRLFRARPLPVVFAERSSKR